MVKGELALVLHAHLPYVRSKGTGSLEEDWFFQALMECYLPLLQSIEKAASSKNQQPKITIGLSPTLLALLEDIDLKEQFPEWLTIRLELLKSVSKSEEEAAEHLSKTIKKQLAYWEQINGDVIKRFAVLQAIEVIDVITCAATHGYLPLLRENPESINGQLKTAVREHIRLFNVQPLGIWLPECAYYEGLDLLMVKAGLRYAVLDGHGLLHASPRPRYGLYAPICTKNGVAFFGRDSDSTLPVWSAKDGYPGDPVYREFHRDLGWDIPQEQLNTIGIQDSRPLGLKLYKVTSQRVPLDKKETYEPKLALKKIKQHAKDFLKSRKTQLEELDSKMTIKPLLVAPFDAELFGHWWFEGPVFLEELFRQAKSEEIKFTRLVDVLSRKPKLQLCAPCPSSWGKGGYHDYWLNETNSWVVPEWNKASKALIDKSTKKLSNEIDLRILKQAARELLLAQSSDWSFILRAGTTTTLAKERINLHLKRFWRLINALDGQEKISPMFLQTLEEEDSLFPLIDPNDWLPF